MSSSSTSNELIFSYHSSNIYRDDLRLLNAPNWLNDEIITFAMDYFQHELFVGHAIRFVSPGTAFIMMHETDKDDLADIVNGQELTEAKLLFLPVSDTSSLTKGGGSQWSLLVYDGDSNKFWYFDSAAHYNSSSAAKLASQLAPYLIRSSVSTSTLSKLTTDTVNETKDITLATPSASSSTSTATTTTTTITAATTTTTLPFGRKVVTTSGSLKAKKKNEVVDYIVSAKCPQQTNGYDCGVYAIALSHALASRHIAGKSIRDIDLQDDLIRSCSPSSITLQRRTIGEYIEVVKKRIASGATAEGKA